MCSMLSGKCPSSTIAGYQFTNHYDCVNAGYASHKAHLET